MSYAPNSSLFQKSYMSKVSIVDGQSLFNQENPRREHIEMLRSADRFRATTLPQQMPASEASKFEKDPRMVSLSDSISQLPPGERIHRATLSNAKSKLRRQALKEYQNLWAEEEYQRHVKSNTIADIRKPEAIQGLSAAQKDFQILRPLIPERSRIADIAMGVSKHSLEARRQICNDLTSLCHQDEQVFYRPSEAPIEGHCPVLGCKEDILAYVPQLFQSD